MPGNFISTPWKFYYHVLEILFPHLVFWYRAWYFDPVTLIYFHAEKKYFHAEKKYFRAEKKIWQQYRQQINPNPQYFVPLMDTNLH